MCSITAYLFWNEKKGAKQGQKRELKTGTFTVAFFQPFFASGGSDLHH
jgi:hypothetical protein